MKATVRVDMISEVYAGEPYEVLKAVSGLYEDADNIEVVSVEMTPEEQIGAFEFLVERFEDCED